MIKWQELLRIAQDFLSSAKISFADWSFGGGTALMLYYNHRESKDIDIFFRDAQFIILLTPRLNDYVENKVDEYVEMSNFLKLRIGEHEIDFIVAPYLTPCPVALMEINGQTVNVETPEEIIIKKLFYRAESLKARDFFDLACVVKHDKEKLLENLNIFHRRLPAIKERFDKIRPYLNEELKTLNIIDSSVDPEHLCSEFLKECLSHPCYLSKLPSKTVGSENESHRSQKR